MSEKTKLPQPDKMKHIAKGLSALDILFCDRAPVFTFEKNWHTEVSTLLIDTRDGGQLSVRFSGNAALIKGTRADAFMHPGGTPPFTPETRLGFVTYPGLLAGFPPPLENLLMANDSFPYLTFCLWHLHESGTWQSGAVSPPTDVDDPDGSDDLLKFFNDPINVFARASSELYGLTITDIDALNEVFKQKPLTDLLLKRLGVRKPLQSFSRRLHEIEYGTEPYVAPEPEKKHNEEAASSRDENKSAKNTSAGAKQSREEQLKGSTKFTTPASIGEAIGDFFKEKSEFFKEHSAGDIAQEALATALGAVTDVINQVPSDSPIRIEPFFKWQRLTNAKLILARKIGMAGMLDTLTAEYVINVRKGRRAALLRFVDAFENDFRTMPQFLIESFEQLQGFYQRASEEYQADAEIFRARAERCKNKGTESVKILTDLPVIKILCPEDEEHDRLLNRLKRVLRDCGHNSYFISSELVTTDGAMKQHEITLVSRDTEKVLEALQSNLSALEFPEGSCIINHRGEKIPVH